MRPALWMAAALAVGVAAADWLRPHPAVALAALFVLAVWALRRGRQASVALLALVAVAGMLRYSYVQTAGRGDLAAWSGQKVTVVATVVGEPELKQPQSAAYVAAAETVDDHPASGKLYVTQWSGTAPGYGERVVISGMLKEPAGPRVPGGFDQAAFLGRQSVYLVMDTQEAHRLGPGAVGPVRRIAVAARLRLESVLKATLPAQDAALMAGLLFGSRSDLPDDVKQAFKASGVFHLLAVSGGNLAMIFVPLLGLLRRAGLHQRKGSAVVIPLVIFFVFLTGGSPSVLRAGLMAILVLAGDVLGRERNALNTLGSAVFLLLLWSPGLLFDLGFQLSVAATLGILLFARPIERWLTRYFQPLFGEKAGGWLAAGLSVTLAAQVMVEPISLYQFGATSLVAPVANLLVLAFLEPLVNVGMSSVLVGLLVVPVALLLNWIVRAGVWVLIFVVKATAAVPGAYLNVGRISVWTMLLWYATVMFVAVPTLQGRLMALAQGLIAHWTEGSPGLRRAVVAGLILTLGTGLTWRVALSDPPDLLEVTFLDVGQGDAILIAAPGGHTMLVDAGPATWSAPVQGQSGFNAGEEVVVPFLAAEGITHLDYLVLTHPDLDHAGGAAAVLRQVSAGLVLNTGPEPTEKAYTEALAVAEARAVPQAQPIAGDRYSLGPGVAVEVLNPEAGEPGADVNDNCIALRVQYRDLTMLLACDMGPATEEHLLAAGVPLSADLLKVSHHGSGKSSTAPFLEAVHPRWAVIPVGNGNRYGHPQAAALDRLNAVGAAVYRTDRYGTITLKTTGTRIVLSGAKGGPEDDTYHPLGIIGRRWIRAW